MNKTIIAIDGPSGVGKGTLARNIARFYGFAHLDTGSLYRAMTLHLINSGADMDNLTEELVTAETQKISDDLSILEYAKSPDIRDVKVGKFVSPVASFGKAREVIKKFQVDFGHFPPALKDGSPAKGAVVEGRDITTAIFPDAPLKIYLNATPEEKARRRVKQYADEGIEANYDEILADQIKRDQGDTHRTHGALMIAPDAHVIDNSNLQKEDTFEIAKGLIKDTFGL